MTLYLLAAVGLYFFLISLKKKIPGEENCIFDRDFTTGLKGLTILMVVECHLFKYNALKGAIAIPLWIVGGVIDQIAVASFFLFSGFGIMLGFMHSGRAYAKRIVSRHILLLLLFNMVFLIPFYVRDIILNGIDKPWYVYLEVLVGFENLGNIGWFIYAILFCYLAAALSGILPFKKDFGRALAMSVCCLAYFVFMIARGASTHNYDTVLAFPAGVFIALYQEKLKTFLSDRKRTCKILIVTSGIYALMTLLYLVLKDDYYGFIRVPKTLLFVVIVLCANQYYTIRSKIWYFLGQHTWPIFILHMLPIRMMEGAEMSKSLYYIVVAAMIAGVSAIGILIEMLAKRILIGNKEKQ